MTNPRDVTLDIVGHDRTERATRSAGNNLDRLKRKADEVDQANKRLGDRAAAHIRKMSDSMIHAAKVITSTGPLAVVAAIGVAIGALPIIAAAAGMGIVAALGGGLAAVGLVFAAKNEEVKKSFTGLKTHVVKSLTEMSAPFKKTLLAISQDMRDAFRSLRPELKTAFERLAPIVEKFSDDLFKALDKLEPALDPVVDGFKVLARELGAGMPGLLEDVATAFTDISEALKDNPQAIREVVTGLGDLIKTSGQVIAWLIRMNGQADATEAGFDTLMWTGVLAFATIAAKAHDAVADILESWGRIPGPTGAVFRKMAAAARSASDEVQAKLDNIKTNKAQAELRAAEARLRVLGNMEATPEVKAEISQLKQKIAEARAALKKIDGKTATTYINAIYKAAGSNRNVRIKVPNDAAGGVAFALTAPAGGSSRTGGPATPDVYATTYVTIDGAAIRSIARTVVDQASGRQAHRARVGRR